MGSELKKARRIAVLSGKGGVGKSIITANLAASLSTIGRRILVIDADLGLASLDVILGITPVSTIQESFRGEQPIEQVLLSTRGFDFVPAASGLPEGTVLTERLTAGVESAIASLEDRYDAILFDAGAGIGDVVMFIAGLADEILLVVTPEPACLMDIYATIKVLYHTHGKRDFLFVVNQSGTPAASADTGARIAAHLQEVISSHFESQETDPVRIRLAGSIPVDTTVKQAVMRRRLLGETNPDAPATRALTHLAAFIDTVIRNRKTPESC